ncbi:hypothetical protein ABT116_37745, partial [Streptomyces sp. NPDC002130]
MPPRTTDSTPGRHDDDRSPSTPPVHPEPEGRRGGFAAGVEADSGTGGDSDGTSATRPDEGETVPGPGPGQ